MSSSPLVDYGDKYSISVDENVDCPTTGALVVLVILLVSCIVIVGIYAGMSSGFAANYSWSVFTVLLISGIFVVSPCIWYRYRGLKKV